MMNGAAILNELANGFRMSSTVPIVPTRTVDSTPIRPTKRWIKVGKGMKRTYEFITPDERRSFLIDVLDYELKVCHNAKMTVEDGKVVIELITHTADCITELDKEYARFADSVYRDVIMSAASIETQDALSASSAQGEVEDNHQGTGDDDDAGGNGENSGGFELIY